MTSLTKTILYGSRIVKVLKPMGASMDEIKIETNRPLPVVGGRFAKYPWGNTPVGGSFVLLGDDTAIGARTAAKIYAKRTGLNLEYKIRTIAGRHYCVENKMKLGETGFVAINIDTNPPHMMIWSFAGYANQVRKAILKNWPDRDGVRPTWNDIKRDGVRVRKIKIETY